MLVRSVLVNKEFIYFPSASIIGPGNSRMENSTKVWLDGKLVPISEIGAEVLSDAPKFRIMRHLMGAKEPVSIDDIVENVISVRSYAYQLLKQLAINEFVIAFKISNKKHYLLTEKGYTECTSS